MKKPLFVFFRTDKLYSKLSIKHLCKATCKKQ